jgi:voltage-gated potassium channel
MTKLEEELQNINYELFIFAISTLSIVNLLLAVLWRNQPAAGVMIIMNRWFSVFFLFDFLLRFISAESKFSYFFKRFGWADLLSCSWLPVFRLFRLFFIVRVGMLLRQYGEGRILRTFRRERANSILGSVILLIFLVLEFGGTAVLRFESADPRGNIHTADDALWWGIVTIATVGYGDYYPVTTGGQIVGVITIVTGVALFGVVNGFVANSFLRRRAQATDEAEKPQDTQSVAKPGNEPAPQLSPPDSHQDLQTVLAEIQRMTAAEDRNYAGLEARLSRIEEILAQMDSK